jgi:hypothetical protein
VPDGLEDLLVGPTDLTRLLVEMKRRGTVGIQSVLEVEQERGLLRVGRAEAAGAGDLVEAEAGATRRLRVLGDAVVVLAVLGDRQCYPIAGGMRQETPAKL